ncbi:MAG TPA: GNAT family N-acetyltransferase [Pirellulales bacterium]
MATVRHLQRQLSDCPQMTTAMGVTVRSFAGPWDIFSWLELRNGAFARQRIGVRKWSADDFVNEFVSRWWWRPDLMWFAEADAAALDEPPSPTAESSSPRLQLIGSVTLAMRGEADSAKAVVHWLMVDPRWRRRGVAKCLMGHLEVAAWNAGHRAIYLETHTAWQAAAKFYDVMGYQSASS